jgi:hypothetical protein
MARRLKHQVAVEALAESVCSILDENAATDLQKAEWLATTFDQFEAHVQKLAPEPMPASDDGDTSAEDGGSTLPPKLEQFLAAMLEADPKLRRDEALRYLLHHRGGRQLAEHLSTNTKEAPPMNRTDELRSIAKDFGVAKLAKLIIDDGRSHGISESELTTLMMDEAKHKGLSFEKYFTAPENIDLRKALQVAKGARLMDITPVQIGGADVSVDSAKAYDQLVTLAEEQRRRSPWQSAAQAFAAVFDANPELAAMAAQRPAPTTAYPFPR